MHYAKMSPVLPVCLSVPASHTDAHVDSESESDCNPGCSGRAVSWPVVGCRSGIKLRLMLSELMARGKLNGSSFILLELRQSIDAVAGFVTVAGSFLRLSSADQVYKCLPIDSTKEFRPGNFHYQLSSVPLAVHETAIIGFLRPN